MARRQKKDTSTIITQSARPAKPLFRLIPITMLTATCLFGMKVWEIIESGRELRDELLISTVVAQDDETADKPAEETKKDTEEKAADAAEEAAKDTKEKDGEHAAKEEGGHGEESASGEGADKKAAEAAPPPEDIFEKKKSDYNQREVDVLESLSTRRDKLDKWEEEVSLREKLLLATEQRIDQKIAEMNTLSTTIKSLLVAYTKEEDTKISSLVKIYEAMKPKEAARIFEEMDMDILLMVIDRMSERRVAPVLAAMSPEKAKNVTEELAATQKMKPVGMDGAAALPSDTGSAPAENAPAAEAPAEAAPAEPAPTTPTN